MANKLVYMQMDSVDRHGNCDCGLCDSNGKSYGESIYDVTDMRENIELAEDNVDWLQDEMSEEHRLIERIYAPSEQAAHANALLHAATQMWEMA
jgi:hypothetical protein